MAAKLDKQSFSVWNYKPWWCQPWSIILTGVVIIAGSWLLTKTIWITILLCVPILAWWGYFLVLYPQLVKQAYFANSPVEEL
ncbi:MAG: hypothetical protein QNJ41_04815 [Xenococcaceae cyanobacterium MO_188.B32]|nr:hypothetical protein [Xenococcaceae cyanobacterium MO_188.B32]